MTEPTFSQQQPPVTPTRRDRLRPLELVGFSGVLAVFAGLIVLLVLRTSDGGVAFVRAGIVSGAVFIVALLVVALIGLGTKPSEADLAARKDLYQPDSDADGWH